MALVLTQVYLEANQKKALAAKAKSSGRKSSDLLREAVDAMLLGVNPQELKQLDEATKRAQVGIDAMLKALATNAKDHRTFMAQIGRLRKSSSR